MMRPIFIVIAMLSACGGGSGGEFECRGAECVCPGTGDCVIDCIGNCDLQCAGSGGCEFYCGEACQASCTGNGPCVVEVGQGSNVDCTGSGDCTVGCNGDCTVACPGSGVCAVTCAEGAICELTGCDSPSTCADGTLVCNGVCL